MSTMRVIKQAYHKGNCSALHCACITLMTIKRENTKLALFADDTAIIARSMSTPLTSTYASRYLSRIIEYFDRLKLKINIEKCEVTKLMTEEIT